LTRNVVPRLRRTPARRPRRPSLAGARHPWRAALAPALLAAVALGCSACGATGSPLARVDAAATQTLTQPAGFNLALGGATAFGPTRRPLFALGDADFPIGTIYEALDLRSVPGRLPYMMFFLFQPNRVLLQPSPASARLLPAGKFWIAVGAGGTGPAPRRSRRLVAQLEALTPELALREIAWGAQAASSVGEQVVDHVPTAEYTATVDLAKAAAAAGRAHSPVLAAAIAGQVAALRAQGGNGSTLDVHLWVDGPGYVEQLQLVPPGAGLGTTTFSLSGFGRRIQPSLVAPPLVVGLNELVRSGRAPASPWDVSRT
jgi:hypothetical protein